MHGFSAVSPVLLALFPPAQPAGEVIFPAGARLKLEADNGSGREGPA